MAPKKSRKKYTPEEKAAALVKVTEKGVTAASRELGVKPSVLYTWRKAAAKRTTPAKAAANGAATKAAGTKAANAAANGAHANGAEDAPTLQLGGLRSWVRRAVHDELKPVRDQLAKLLDSMGRSP